MVSNTAGFIFLIPKHDPCNDVSITDEVTNDGTGENSKFEKDTDSSSVSFTFTAEEELKYSTRFAEGYNLCDPKYVAWLKSTTQKKIPVTSSEYFLML